MHCPLFDRIFRFTLAASFGLDTIGDELALLPAKGDLKVRNREAVLMKYS